MNAPTPSPFLSGNFAPVREERRLDNLPVDGELPAGLRGVFVRVGPNPQHPPRGRYHWFDGDGMVHSVTFTPSGASYQNRFVHTEGFLKEQARGEAIWTGLAEPPDLMNPDGAFKNVANTAGTPASDDVCKIGTDGRINDRSLNTCINGQHFQGNTAAHAVTPHANALGIRLGDGRKRVHQIDHVNGKT